jgi:tRNA 2-thiouridine synthesizing protein A
VSGYPEHWDFDEVFDSVDRGCGDFILDLKHEMAGLPAGGVLMIASRDAGAPIEIPAWCRLTGHDLIEAAPPFYLLRRRGDRLPLAGTVGRRGVDPGTAEDSGSRPDPSTPPASPSAGPRRFPSSPSQSDAFPSDRRTDVP